MAAGFVFHVCLLIFISTGVVVPCVGGRLRTNLPLIFEVQKQYKSSSVCLLLPHKERYSPEHELGYNFTREFSRNFVRTVVTSYGGTEKLLSTYGHTGTRPLAVVLLRAVKDIHNFGRNVQMSRNPMPIWLLIFTDEFGTPVCEFCKRPMGNMFGLRFHTEMLVSCCKDPTINEWWSVRKNQTKVAPYGTWNTRDGLSVMVDKQLYARRNQLDGISLRVVAQSVIHNQLGQRVSFKEAVFMELQQLMNFEITTIKTSDIVAGTGSVHKVVAFVAEGNADVSISASTIAPDIRRLVDFTSTISEVNIQLVIKNPVVMEKHWASYLQEFRYTIWVTLLAMLIATAALLTIIQIKKRTFQHSYFTNFLHLLGIFCTQGLPVFPLDTTLRIIYYSIYILAVLVSAAYSGSLTSSATLSTSSLPFSTLEGIAKDGSYMVSVLPNSAVANFLKASSDPVMSRLKTLMKPEHLLPKNKSVAFQQVNQDYHTVQMTPV